MTRTTTAASGGPAGAAAGPVRAGAAESAPAAVAAAEQAAVGKAAAEEGARLPEPELSEPHPGAERRAWLDRERERQSEHEAAERERERERDRERERESALERDREAAEEEEARAAARVRALAPTPPPGGRGGGLEARGAGAGGGAGGRAEGGEEAFVSEEEAQLRQTETRVGPEQPLAPRPAEGAGAGLTRAEVEREVDRSAGGAPATMGQVSPVRTWVVVLRTAWSP